MNKTINGFNKVYVAKDEVLIWWLGGASFYLKNNNKKILIDPYLTNSAYDVLKPFFANPEEDLIRLKESPLKPSEIDCNYYICTHDHLDHLDPYTIKSINNKDNIIFIGPNSCGEHFRKLGISEKNILIINKGQTIKLDNDICITAINAKHRGPLDIEESLRLNKEVYGPDDGQGYILSINSISIYHTSDTEYIEDFQNLESFNIDLALIAANGKGGNLTPEEGVLMANIIKPKVVIPMHYGILPFTDFNPNYMREAFKRCNSGSELKILSIGDFYTYKKEIQ